MVQIITAASGFLLAVLWFDLMFDVQVLAHRRAANVPDAVLASIAAYYHRVTTAATPMGRLVAVVMLALIAALVAQAARHDAPVWVSATSFVAALLGIGLAMTRTFPAARRLGARTDPLATQSTVARNIFREHVVCFASMATLLTIQLVAA